ncbi:flavin-containing monooxygenase [Fretibacter rubidus]|uniref:flavin-containing monooxygenase n=1 Tax=Fretibacter rubidus TaxID=570162 RepID=UPI00352B68D8
MNAVYTDVLIIGAGLSGIGAAVHLSKNCPNKSFAILERRANMGGTWDLFKYPGIRSDSDMHTLGYDFKPWTDAKAIADGPAILKYIKETAAEYNLTDHIAYEHVVTRADWNSDTARWTVTVDTPSGPVTRQCHVLYMCSGYYRYDQGYRPEFAGEDDFNGQIIHPQHWPEALDYTGKKIVIIGSGATAVTLMPNLAKDAAHVTMLQRSPTYMGVMPSTDRIANGLRAVLPSGLAYKITRWKNLTMGRWVYNWMRNKPEKAKAFLFKKIKKALGKDYPLSPNFTPDYNPWDQRLCLVPDNDMFDAMVAGKADVVTDNIERFTQSGVALKSGAHLDADIIVTATGLNLQILGGADFYVDGAPVDFGQTYSYEGMMFSDVPNMASVFGYVNASWTLRADLISRYLCRVINHMDATQTQVFTPVAPDGMEMHPWMDFFKAGYLQRSLHALPKQGDREPWLNLQDYTRDKKVLPTKPIDDGAMVFSNPKVKAEVEAAE